MTDLMEMERLAQIAYRFAEEHYGDKDARFDVIVECMTRSEIAEELAREKIRSESGAIKWAKRRAGLHFEQELNAAWDGPESVKSSSRYDPAHDAAGFPLRGGETVDEEGFGLIHDDEPASPFEVEEMNFRDRQDGL